jgi:hypothetical protein
VAGVDVVQRAAGQVEEPEKSVRNLLERALARMLSFSV